MNRAFVLLLLTFALNFAIAFFMLARYDFFAGLASVAVNFFAVMLIGYMAVNAGKPVEH